MLCYDCFLPDTPWEIIRPVTEEWNGAVNKDQYLLQSLDNALGVLSLFLQEDKLTLSQIAQRSGLNKTVAYRIVYTLEKRGYLNADREGRYRPGIQLAALGARAQMSRAAGRAGQAGADGALPGD